MKEGWGQAVNDLQEFRNNLLCTRPYAQHFIYITLLILTSTLWGSEIELVTQQHLVGKWQSHWVSDLKAALKAMLSASLGYLARVQCW